MDVAKGRVSCPNGHLEESNVGFCRECGSALRPATCRNGHEIRAEDRHCGQCGAPKLEPQSARTAPAQPASRNSRKYCESGHLVHGDTERCTCGSTRFSERDPLASG